MIKIQENILLAPMTTLGVGGPAKNYVEVRTLEELQDVFRAAKKNRWPVFILGGGSNVIISDKGFNGLIIRILFGSSDLNGQIINSGSGVLMSDLVNQSINAELKGLEWAGGLPGTLGGAIRGNAGAFGGEIKDSVELVSSVDIKTGEEKKRTKTECQFGYRDSIFKRVNEVIIGAKLKLTAGNREELREIADHHINYRKEKNQFSHPSAGSTFKNIPIEKFPKQALDQFQDVIKTDPIPLIPIAAVIDRAGLKGLQVGQAQVAPYNANFVVNLGGAKAVEIVELIDKVRAAVKDKYHIELEVEPDLVGLDLKN